MDNNNVSKAEWLCAALIDLLPIAIIIKLPTFIYNIASSVSYYSTMPKSGSWHWQTPKSFGFFDTIHIAFLVLGAIYLLLKDAFGPSLGKRIMGIKLQKDGNDADMKFLILRNVVLAICFSRCGLEVIDSNIFFWNLFFLYSIAELFCVNFTHKTIGDNICKLNLARTDNYVPGKINDHSYCIITIIILFLMVGGLFTPSIIHMFLKNQDVAYDPNFFKKIFFISQALNIIPTILVYAYLLYKLIKPKAFRWTAIIITNLIYLASSIDILNARI